MTRLIVISLFLYLVSFPAFPQISTEPEGEIISQPICSFITNRSQQTMLGTISTAAQKVASGDVIRHQENFRLAAGARQEFCAAGPFYQGRRLEITLRTLMPLFSCKTKIDREIFLDALEDEYGFKKLSATCY